jgi:hypothetical protein
MRNSVSHDLDWLGPASMESSSALGRGGALLSVVPDLLRDASDVSGIVCLL